MFLILGKHAYRGMNGLLPKDATTAVFLIRMIWAFRTFHQQAKMKKILIHVLFWFLINLCMSICKQYLGQKSSFTFFSFFSFSLYYCIFFLSNGTSLAIAEIPTRQRMLGLKQGLSQSLHRQSNLLTTELHLVQLANLINRLTSILMYILYTEQHTR